MAFINGHASSSKIDRSKPRERSGKPKVKSNQLKRAKVDEELKDLQARVDSFVRDEQVIFCLMSLLILPT